MKKPSQANEPDYAELAQALDLFAERALASDAAQLVAQWPGLERRVLARLHADERDERNAAGGLESPLLRADEQRIRNLAWEIGVSVDLYAVHLGALRTLARVLRERGQRFERRSASRASNAPVQPLDG